MMLTFGTFLEHAAAEIDRQAEQRPALKRIPPLLDSHVFWLGDDKEFYDHIVEIREDLVPEMETKIHLPFSDTTTVSVIRLPGQLPIWTLDRIIEEPSYLDDLIDPDPKHEAVGQRLFVLRYQAVEQIPIKPDPILTWMITYQGVKDGKMYFNFMPSSFIIKVFNSEEKIRMLQKESKIILDVAASISHPENYLVQVTPELTPKEERKVALGRPRPAQKAKHFIIVDHTVLVKMRGEANGTHASPIPHERRGHWRRVAERCRHARLLGKERVFVRPALVGDPAWKHEKNFYEVLPDKLTMVTEGKS